MRESGRILIADDEESFLKSTAHLLREEGYHCDCAADANAAEEMLRANSYDLLIADIKMPGNADLEFIRALPAIADGLPVILVTAYPALGTAIESIQLPVVSYMVKPFEFDELVKWVWIGMGLSSTFATVDAFRKRLEKWNEDLVKLAELARRPRASAASVSISTFLDLTLNNIIGALSDLKNVTEAVAVRQGEPAVCHLLNCPRPAALVKGLREAVAVLEKSRRSFKSKELAQLRLKLTALADGANEIWGPAQAGGSSGP